MVFPDKLGLRVSAEDGKVAGIVISAGELEVFEPVVFGKTEAAVSEVCQRMGEIEAWP